MSLPKPFYQRGGATIYHGDALALLPLIEARSVPACVVDPPYGVAFEGKAHKFRTADGGYCDFADGDADWMCLVPPAVAQLRRIAPAVVITTGVEHAFDYPRPDWIGTIYYPSGSGMCRWGFTCADLLFYYGRDPYLARGLGSRPNSLSSTEHAERTDHPCPKPVGTMAWLIERVALEGETVLDCFLGSGTTAVAAIRTGRKCIGIELSEPYCEIAARRLDRELDQPTLPFHKTTQGDLL